MKLGFIGTGKIASSVITGICKSSIKYKKIIISSRNASKAKNLKNKYKKIIIEKNNQKIIDNCNWVFLAVTPSVGKTIIKNLKFRYWNACDLKKPADISGCFCSDEVYINFEEFGTFSAAKDMVEKYELQSCHAYLIE